MTLGLLFWIIMLLCVIWYLPFHKYGTTYPWANGLVPLILIAILGWQVFGAAIK